MGTKVHNGSQIFACAGLAGPVTTRVTPARTSSSDSTARTGFTGFSVRWTVPVPQVRGERGNRPGPLRPGNGAGVARSAGEAQDVAGGDVQGDDGTAAVDCHGHALGGVHVDHEGARLG